MSLIYLILMELEVVYKLANKRIKVLKEEKKPWYLQAIEKRMHLFYIGPDIIFLLHKLA